MAEKWNSIIRWINAFSPSFTIKTVDELANGVNFYKIASFISGNDKGNENDLTGEKFHFIKKVIKKHLDIDADDLVNFHSLQNGKISDIIKLALLLLSALVLHCVNHDRTDDLQPFYSLDSTDQEFMKEVLNVIFDATGKKDLNYTLSNLAASYFQDEILFEDSSLHAQVITPSATKKRRHSFQYPTTPIQKNIPCRQINLSVESPFKIFIESPGLKEKILIKEKTSEIHRLKQYLISEENNFIELEEEYKLLQMGAKKKDEEIKELKEKVNLLKPFREMVEENDVKNIEFAEKLALLEKEYKNCKNCEELEKTQKELENEFLKAQESYQQNEKKWRHFYSEVEILKKECTEKDMLIKTLEMENEKNQSKLEGMKNQISALTESIELYKQRCSETTHPQQYYDSLPTPTRPNDENLRGIIEQKYYELHEELESSNNQIKKLSTLVKTLKRKVINSTETAKEYYQGIWAEIQNYEIDVANQRHSVVDDDVFFPEKDGIEIRRTRVRKVKKLEEELELCNQNYQTLFIKYEQVVKDLHQQLESSEKQEMLIQKLKDNLEQTSIDLANENNSRELIEQFKNERSRLCEKLEEYICKEYKNSSSHSLVKKNNFDFFISILKDVVDLLYLDQLENDIVCKTKFLLNELEPYVKDLITTNEKVSCLESENQKILSEFELLKEEYDIAKQQEHNVITALEKEKSNLASDLENLHKVVLKKDLVEKELKEQLNSQKASLKVFNSTLLQFGEMLSSFENDFEIELGKDKNYELSRLIKYVRKYLEENKKLNLIVAEKNNEILELKNQLNSLSVELRDANLCIDCEEQLYLDCRYELEHTELNLKEIKQENAKNLQEKLLKYKAMKDEEIRILLERSKKEIAAKNEEVVKLQHQCKDYKSKMEDIIKEFKNLSENMKHVMKTSDTYEKEASNLVAKYSKAKENIQKLSTEKENLKKEFKSLSQEYKKLKELNKELKTALEDSNRCVASFKQRIDIVESNFRKEEEKNLNLLKQLQKAQCEIANLKKTANKVDNFERRLSVSTSDPFGLKNSPLLPGRKDNINKAINISRRKLCKTPLKEVPKIEFDQTFPDSKENFAGETFQDINEFFSGKDKRSPAPNTPTVTNERIGELQRRNTMYKPHLKSYYAIEMQSQTPSRGSYKAIKDFERTSEETTLLNSDEVSHEPSNKKSFFKVLQQTSNSLSPYILRKTDGVRKMYQTMKRINSSSPRQ